MSKFKRLLKSVLLIQNSSKINTLYAMWFGHLHPILLLKLWHRYANYLGSLDYYDIELETLYKLHFWGYLGLSQEFHSPKTIRIADLIHSLN